MNYFCNSVRSYVKKAITNMLNRHTPRHAVAHEVLMPQGACSDFDQFKTHLSWKKSVP
jgi:hypothetical protein